MSKTGLFWSKFSLLTGQSCPCSCPSREDWEGARGWELTHPVLLEKQLEEEEGGGGEEGLLC